jgi:hypothetical protein
MKDLKDNDGDIISWCDDVVKVCRAVLVTCRRAVVEMDERGRVARDARYEGSRSITKTTKPNAVLASLKGKLAYSGWVCEKGAWCECVCVEDRL